MTELQLLVIDLGDCCVVKVEKGGGAPLPGNPLGVGIEKVYTYPIGFENFRSLLDETKPVPRIQCYPSVTNPGQEVFFIVSEHHSQQMFQCDLDALSQLARHPLPIYEGGKWEQLGTLPNLIPVNNLHPDQDLSAFADVYIHPLPFKAWRYTR